MQVERILMKTVPILFLYGYFPAYGERFSYLDFYNSSPQSLVKMESRLEDNLAHHPEFSHQNFMTRLQNFEHGKIREDELDLFIDQWFSFHRGHQKIYNEYILLKQSYIITKAWDNYNNFRLTSPFLKKNDTEFHKELKKIYLSWLDNKDYMGGTSAQELEHHRSKHRNFHGFFEKLNDYYQFYRSSNPQFFKMYLSPQYSSNIHNNWHSPLSRMPVMTFSTISMFNNFIFFIPDVAFPSKNGFLGVPLSKKINNFLRDLKHYQGIKTRIINRHKLPKFKNPKTKNVYLFLPPHQIGKIDAFLMSDLKLPKYLIFSHPLAFSPNLAIAKKLAEHPQFISVGVKSSKNQGSMQQLEYALSSHEGNIIVNYPQGHLEPSYVMPVNGTFDENLIHHLQRQGYKIHVIPLMWHLPSTFPLSPMDIPKNLPLNHFSGEVCDEVSPKMIQYLMKKEFPKAPKASAYPQLFSMFLRSLWMEKKQDFKDLTIDELNYRVEKMLPGA